MYWVSHVCEDGGRVPAVVAARVVVRLLLLVLLRRVCVCPRARVSCGVRWMVSSHTPTEFQHIHTTCMAMAEGMK